MDQSGCGRCLFAFVSLYTQIPGLYGPEGLLPAQKNTTAPRQESVSGSSYRKTPTLLWEALRPGLDIAQGLHLLTLLSTVVVPGALLLNSLRHPSPTCCCGLPTSQPCDSLLLETDFLAILVAPPKKPSNHKAHQGGLAGALPHENLPFWLVFWLLFQLMFASGVVKLTSCSPAWWGLTGPAHTSCLVCAPPASLAGQAQCVGHLPQTSSVFPPICHLWLTTLCTQVLLQVLIIITGNYNFFNLLTLVFTTSFLDDCPADHAIHTTGSDYGLLAYGTVHYFGLEVDWQQHIASSLKQPSPSTMAEDGNSSYCVAGGSLPGLGIAYCPLDVDPSAKMATEVLCQYPALHPGHCHSGLVLDKPSTLLLYGAWDPRAALDWGSSPVQSVEHLQLVSSYGLFRWMTGLGGRPEVVLEGSDDGQHWTEIEFMYKPGNFAALGPQTHSPWLTSLVLSLLQDKEPVICLVRNHVAKYPFHEQPPTYLRAQRCKYWFSKAGGQSQWWHGQWVEEFFPPVSLGHPTLEMLLQQFGLKDKSPFQAQRAGNALAQTLNWVRTLLSSLESPSCYGDFWGLEEKRKQISEKDSRAASEQAAVAPTATAVTLGPPEGKELDVPSSSHLSDRVDPQNPSSSHVTAQPLCLRQACQGRCSLKCHA
ncbi:hypothetical protein U0070_018170 [Myodes glareolus]|uniref:Lipase maturation factor n=1 Tax=Myodes glareolus TaxID=447135 RepID=A0AAW0HYL9_MYOGA